RDGKIFVVPVRINETITLGFILDTGASNVQIPADVARTLNRAGTILESDFLGTEICTLANGSEVKCETYRLREMGLGNHVVKNVTANIGPPKSDLLLGQSFLSRFGFWTIDNARSLLV